MLTRVRTTILQTGTVNTECFFTCFFLKKKTCNVGIEILRLKDLLYKRFSAECYWFSKGNFPAQNRNIKLMLQFHDQCKLTCPSSPSRREMWSHPCIAAHFCLCGTPFSLAHKFMTWVQRWSKSELSRSSYWFTANTFCVSSRHEVV